VSRHIDSDAKYVYRAVVTRDYPTYTDRWGNVHEGHSATEYCGPFSARGHASAALSRAKKTASSWWVYGEAPTITGRVERAPLNWEGME
jgi:hypothetical protein